MSILRISLEDVDNLTDIIEATLNNANGNDMPLKEYHTHKIIVPIRKCETGSYEIAFGLPYTEEEKKRLGV